MTRQDWTRIEVEATVSDYFAMLQAELSGLRYNKAEHNARLLTLLDGRSRGAVEFKHCNISAILIGLGCPYIRGYQPRGNYQSLLRDVVVECYSNNAELWTTVSLAVERPVTVREVEGAWDSVVVPVPQRPESTRFRYVAEGRPRPVRTVDFLEREARNAALGKAGEAFVLDIEERRLRALGKQRLANRIEHVARTVGDGLGYDIRSFESDGRERLIEVKTTRFGAYTPFFVSRNEVDVSSREREVYSLYRVFDFVEKPRLFMLPGSLLESTRLRPDSFRAELR